MRADRSVAAPWWSSLPHSRDDLVALDGDRVEPRAVGPFTWWLEPEAEGDAGEAVQT